MKFKKLFIFFVVFILFANFGLASNSYALMQVANNDSNDNSKSSVTKDLKLYSKAAILVEAKTGTVLYDKNSTKKMYPASTTKIMTAILTIENGNLKDTATASYDAVSVIPSGYSSAYLLAGEKMSVEDLLKVLLVHSANDAANVLAEHISGSIDDFVNLMNKKLEEIGCKDTHFVNTNGIHDENHYSTASDLAKIANYCMKNDTFRRLVSLKNCKIPATNKSPQRYYPNTNDLIVTTSKYYLPECIGIKTGYTSEAQNCLVSACKKNNLNLISIILGASLTPDGKSARYVDSKTLYEYGFKNYSISKIAEKDFVIDTVDIKNATDETKNLDLILENNVVALKEHSDEVSYDIVLNKNLAAPISANSVIGTATYKVGENDYTVNLLASHNVEKKTNIFIFIFIGIGLLILIVGTLVVVIVSKKSPKN